MAELDLLQYYPKSKRNVADRLDRVDEKVKEVSRRFGQEYFDGDRIYGYGGYNYHPRFWTDTVRHIRDCYQLPAHAKILDVGCAKGFMMHDFKLLMPEIDIRGIDVSRYAIDNAIDTMKSHVQVGDAAELPFADGEFDLVLAINTIHNLPNGLCRQALWEIQRVTRKDAFVMVDAWRTDEEKELLEAWVLTAKTYMHVDDWKQMFDEVGYRGDYYWFIP